MKEERPSAKTGMMTNDSADCRWPSGNYL